MIQVNDICKSFDKLQVLKSVSLSIADGEMLTIVGPSGAGKTTLLQIIGSLERPDSGSVIFDGEDITRLKDSRLAAFRNRNMGFVFQFHQLLPESHLKKTSRSRQCGTTFAGRFDSSCFSKALWRNGR